MAGVETREPTGPRKSEGRLARNDGVRHAQARPHLFGFELTGFSCWIGSKMDQPPSEQAATIPRRGIYSPTLLWNPWKDAERRPLQGIERSRKSVLTNRYVIALVVPIILIVSSAFAKKLVRGTTWERADFFLGVELSLASIAATLTNFLELAKEATDGTIKIDPNSLAKNGAFLAICFFLLLVVLTTHQEWQGRKDSPRAQMLWLGVFANMMGAGLLVTFIILVKGI